MSYGSIEQDSVAIMEHDKKLTIDGPPASSPSVVKGHDDDTASSANVYQLFREDGTNTGHWNDRDQLGWILIQQLSVACVVCNAGPRLASLYQHWRCINDQRPPPYSFDEDTGELVLDKNLSYPVHKSTIRVPGIYLCVAVVSAGEQQILTAAHYLLFCTFLTTSFPSIDFGIGSPDSVGGCELDAIWAASQWLFRGRGNRFTLPIHSTANLLWLWWKNPFPTSKTTLGDIRSHEWIDDGNWCK